MASEHEEGQHAVLSPSSAERWISCPASVRMAASLPEPPESNYAAEGTAAHALCEIMARRTILRSLTAAQYTRALVGWRNDFAGAITDEDEMMEHAEAYCAFLIERLAVHPNSHLLLEQKVPTGVPDCWGTTDAAIVSPVHIEAIDLKYGRGIRVEAASNPQLRLYAVGALEAFGDVLGECESVTYTVFQPRLSHIDSETITPAQLRLWRDMLIPLAEMALGPDAPFGPSPDACRFCPASGQCVAQTQFALDLDFGTKPEVLDDAEVADLLDRIPMIEEWCAAVKDVARARAYSGTVIPRYKVVMSSGNRAVVDPEGAIEALKAIGFELNQIVTTKIKGIGELEKLLKKDFDTTLGAFIKKGDGSPSLVPETDKRPAIDATASAVADFS